MDIMHNEQNPGLKKQEANLAKAFNERIDS